MAITQNHVINIQPGVSAPLVIHCSQGDTGTQINLTVVNGDEEFDCSSYACSVHGVRSDGGNWGPITCTVSGSTVCFSLTSAMTAVAGACLAEISVGTVGTANFAMLMENATFGNGVTYSNDVSVYQNILNAVQAGLSLAEAAVTNEKNERIAAVSAEATARADADTTLQNNIDAEAAARANAITAEATARQTADNTLQGNIDSEAAARASADSNLQSQINQIVAPSGEAPSAAEVQNARIGADGVTYDTLGDAIRGQVTDLKSALTDIQDSFFRYESSIFEITSTGASTANNKRILLNVGNPIKANVFIGNIEMMGNANLTGTAKVELATLNNGTYTVYNSVTENVASKQGEATSILTVGKTTIGETYVFVTLDTNHMFYTANVEGKTMVVADNISSNSFTTRNVSNYEVEYKIYCSVSVELVSLVENILTKKIIYEQEELADANSPSNYWWCYQSVVLSAEISYRIELSGNASGNTMYLAVVSNATKEVKQILSVVDNAVKKYRFDVTPEDDSILLIKSVPYGNYGGTYTTVTRTNASLSVGDVVSFSEWSSTGLAFGLNVYIVSGEIIHEEEKIKEINRRVVIVSKDGTGQYKTVIDAVANEPENSVIVVKPGIYTGTIQAFNKRVILIGTDRNKCILKSTDGRYAYPALNCSCGYIENITFISEYVSGESEEIDSTTNGAYAVHCENEYGVGDVLELHHCTFKSDFAPAMGAGLRKDFRLILDDCDLTNNQIIGRGNYTGEGTLGALYIHDSNGEQGSQYASIKDCMLRSSLGNSLTLYQVTREVQNNRVYCDFVNNVLFDKINRYSDNIWLRNRPFESNVFSIDIGYGNSNSVLNN